MHKILTIPALMICLAGNAQDTSLIPMRKGDKWGYCLPDKKMVVAPVFDDADVFYGPLTTAKIGEDYCIINKVGSVLHRSKQYCYTTNDGRHYVAGPHYDSVRLYDEYGNALTPVYNKIGPFNKYGYAEVTSKYVKYGLIDATYREVLTPAWGSITFFSAQRVRVYDASTSRFHLLAMPSGKILSAGYTAMYEPHEGLIMVLKDSLCAFIDTNGREVIAPTGMKETPERIKRGDRYYGEANYENFRTDGFYEGLAVVVQNGKAGYINPKGKIVIPATFEKAFGFSDGRAWVKQNGQWGIIDQQGKSIIPPSQPSPNYVYAKELEALDNYHEGLIAIQKDTLWGYADINGKMVIAPQYSRALPFINGRAAVYKSKELGFIDRTGKWLIPPSYQWAEGVGEWNSNPFADDCAIAQLPNGKWQLIDTTGKALMNVTFDKESHIWFQNGLASATGNGTTYLFTNRGKIVYKATGQRYFSWYGTGLLYDLTDKCYVQTRTGVKYCD